MVFLCYQTQAQMGGQKSFEFLNTPSHARLAALGGVNVSLADRDVNFITSNPSLIGDSLAGWGSAGYQSYVADIGQSSFTYLDTLKKIGMLGMSIQHISYGNMQRYDETGLELGEFNSGETVVMISKSHAVNHFRLGVSLKGIFSSIAGYRASALAMDLGGTFIHPEKQFTVGLVIKNLGFTLSQYTEMSDTPLPFDVQAGMTFKPEHMPLRFSLTAFNMVSGDAYFNLADGGEGPDTAEKIFRHLNFGAEVLIHKNVNLLMGYNYQIHKELKMEGVGGGGFSVGFSGRVKSFEFTFARSGYIQGVAGYTFTLAADVRNLVTRK